MSRSTRIVGANRESESAKLVATVVFPTPPFPEETGMILFGIGLWEASTPPAPIRIAE